MLVEEEEEKPPALSSPIDHSAAAADVGEGLAWKFSELLLLCAIKRCPFEKLPLPPNAPPLPPDDNDTVGDEVITFKQFISAVLIFRSTSIKSNFGESSSALGGDPFLVFLLLPLTIGLPIDSPSSPFKFISVDNDIIGVS